MYLTGKEIRLDRKMGRHFKRGHVTKISENHSTCQPCNTGPNKHFLDIDGQINKSHFACPVYAEIEFTVQTFGPVLSYLGIYV